MNLSNEFANIEKELNKWKNAKRNLKRHGKSNECLLNNPFLSKNAQIIQSNKEIFDTLSDISTDDSEIEIMHIGNKKVSDSSTVIIIDSDNELENIDYLTSKPEYQVLQKVDYLKFEIKNSPILDSSNSSSTDSSRNANQDIIHLDDDLQIKEDCESPIEINQEENRLNLPNVKSENNKRKRKRKSDKRFPNNPELRNDKRMFKYWSQRYDLFERFDMGIKLDKESWYSVTAEYVAKEQAEFCSSSDYVLDGFCGAGGNTIQFAYKCRHVLALDIDSIKVELTKNNCHVYGVDKTKLTIMKDDFYSFANLYNSPGNLNSLVTMPVIDVVFLSPPWGGQDYLTEKSKSVPDFSIDTGKLLNCARLFKPKTIMIFLPRNSEESHLRTFLKSNETLEIFKHGARYKDLTNQKIKAITAIFRCS